MACYQLSYPPGPYSSYLLLRLVLESWMLPQEWLQMGGQQCDDCSQCIATEFTFAQAYPNTADQKFAQHWSTWFTRDHVQQLKSVGINTVRVPLGYWIIEDLVDHRTEFYPRGGIVYLSQGLQWLKDAGIKVILGHHALPGVQTPNQMFTGRCTSNPEFYTPYNYGRALTWTAVMTALSHVHPNFSSVFAIQAVNEPITNASMTPGYGEFQVAFVQTVRLMEMMLGVGTATLASSSSAGLLESLRSLGGLTLFSASLGQANALVDFAGEAELMFSSSASQAVMNALPILMNVERQLGISNMMQVPRHCNRAGLMVHNSFMDINWQNNNPPNPADAAIGPQVYDNHLYYSFGGVADANPEAYLTSICNLARAQADSAKSNWPLMFGEWALATNFDASDAFLRDWADAQKMAYSQSAGWIFWSFRIENSSLAGDTARQWSYLEGVRRGYLTRDPAQYHNASVCDGYRSATH
ncbi:glycoside hydrolase family 5 protein [Vararia minispora EC-137]|uniref:Glycoside hydrolase family 5 protein n=1 Tax=Vararia minispora EC-137 TaxID=1314806 RepID=A0ACB8QDS0_9AGAM|nr:glycoside hydrolase family 5 protein [Vararia minispora EC-137]